MDNSKNPFDILAEQAMKEHRAGKTIDINDLAKQSARDYVYCPECGTRVIHGSGCVTCPSCGWSLCG